MQQYIEMNQQVTKATHEEDVCLRVWPAISNRFGIAGNHRPGVAPGQQQTGQKAAQLACRIQLSRLAAAAFIFKFWPPNSRTG